MPDIPGGPGSQLPYQEFPPLLPVSYPTGVFPLERQVGSGFALSSPCDLLLATHIARG